MSLFNTHLGISAEVLADNGRAAERNLFIGVVLNAVQFRSESSKSIILAVADEESQIDELVGVGQLVEKIEVLLEVGGSVTERSQNEDTFTVVDGLDRGFDGVQIDLTDGGAVDFVGFVVVEEDRGLGMGVPLNHLVEGHLHGGFRGAIAVETRCKMICEYLGPYTGKDIGGSSYFCISDADLLTPRHNRMIRPVTANETRKRVRVRRTRTARHGGRRDLADFQLTPPLGKSMMDVW